MPTPTPVPQVWPTFTLYPTVNATVPVDLGDTQYTIAEHIVQSYQQTQGYPVMDMLSWGIIFMLIIVGVWSIIRRLQRM